MSRWNFAEVWETIAEVQPERAALVQADRRISWREFDQRADAVAAWLLARGLEPGLSVAEYLYSCPEYLESMFASFKLGVPPVNTNYRYTSDELLYLWTNADAGAVVFHGEFVDRIEPLLDRLPDVRVWLWVDDGTAACPEWATPYEDVANRVAERAVAPWGRSPDDLWLLYTGGTTGQPKGVMWRQDDMFALVNATAVIRYPEEGGLDDVRAILSASTKDPPVFVPCAPLMHGTGAIAAFGALSSGGTVVMLESRSFRPEELLDTIERERVKSTVIVGEAFAQPLLAALDAHPEQWDLSSLRLITSSGVMWSAASKAGLLRHNPNLILVDTLGSSEAIGLATSVRTAADHDTGDGAGVRENGPIFVAGGSTQVLTDDGRPVTPGSDEDGMVAYRGRVPLGYYKDEAKSAATFRMIDGVRWSIPGDHARVGPDGELILLGRGSQCINSGGEKVYPEEPEEALRTHPDVIDVACVGVPDPWWGQRVVAMVQLAPGSELDEQALIDHVKTRLAGYKAPKRIHAVESTHRGPNGKLDYRRLRDEAQTLEGG